MYKTVVFDLDGTLLDTLPDLAAAGNAALGQLGLPTHSTEAFRAMVGNGISRLCMQMLPESCRDPATHRSAHDAFREYYQNHLDTHTISYDGVENMLNKLYLSGYQLAVLSNKPDPFVQQLMQRFFKLPFCAVQGALPQFPHKPQPDSLFHIIRQCGTTPDETLYCGDSEVDIQTARNAGVQSVAVSWGFRSREELTAEHPNYLIDQPEQLFELLSANHKM